MDIQGQRNAQDSFSISIVVPMFNEEDVVNQFFARTLPILEGITPHYEIVCVNDGSCDATLALLQGFHARDERIKVVNLTRNFGKESALTAGIDYAGGGDCIVPLDADLQDPPELIPDLVAKWREGYDVVLAVRSDRSSDSFGKRLTASLFYRFMHRMSDITIPPNAGDFRLMDRRVVEALKTLPERTRFMKGLFAWLGFPQVTVPYVRPPRTAGTTKWHYWKLWNFALEGIFSFTTLPLRIWTYLGLAVAFFGLVYMSFIIIRTLFLGVDVPGYASILVTIPVLQRAADDRDGHPGRVSGTCVYRGKATASLSGPRYDRFRQKRAQRKAGVRAEQTASDPTRPRRLNVTLGGMPASRLPN